MKISSTSISRLVVILLGSLLVAAAFYGLANGTIFQHRAEGTSVSGECSGDCGSCGEAATEASAAKNTDTSSGTNTSSVIKPSVFTGTIVEKKTENGTFYALASSKETYMLEAGPTWYQQQKKFVVKPGDLVKITGFEVMDADKQAYIVIYSVTNQSNNTSIVIRDNNGTPMWQTGNQTGNADCADCSGEAGGCNSAQK